MTPTRNPVCPECGWTQGTDRNHIPCVEKAHARIAELEADLVAEAADADSAVDSVVAKVKWYHSELEESAVTIRALRHLLAWPERAQNKAEAEPEAQKALLPVVPTARGGKA